MATSPFDIAVPDSSISELKQKLSLTRWPSELDEAGWNYGSPLTDVKRLAKHWENSFDWRAQESKLNRLPQFKREVPVKGFEDIDMHYVYAPSKVDGAIPLLFVHGCSYLSLDGSSRTLVCTNCFSAGQGLGPLSKSPKSSNP